MSTMTPVEALRLLIEEELTDANFRPYTFLAFIDKRNEYQSACKWNVDVGGAETAGRAATDDPSPGNTDVVKPASLPIGDRVIGHSFSIRRDKIVEAKRTAVGALRELFAEHTRTAFEVIKTGLSAVLYTGTGNAASHGVFGLGFVTTNTNAYAGIDPASHTQWVSYASDNGGTNRNLTKTLISGAVVGMRRMGVEPDVIITTPELVEKYKDLFAADRNLTTSQNGRADLDFTDVFYGGRPVLYDTQCPDNTLFLLRRRDLCLKTYALTSGIMKNEGGETRVQQQAGINFLVAQLPSNNPHAIKFEISVQPQIIIRNRRSVGVITDLTQ